MATDRQSLSHTILCRRLFCKWPIARDAPKLSVLICVCHLCHLWFSSQWPTKVRLMIFRKNKPFDLEPPRTKVKQKRMLKSSCSQVVNDLRLVNFREAS